MLTPMAWAFTSTSSGPGTGVGTSTYWRTSGPPGRSIRMAFMMARVYTGDGDHDLQETDRRGDEGEAHPDPVRGHPVQRDRAALPERVLEPPRAGDLCRRGVR